MGWNGPMTHRQFLVWQVWLDEEMNNPSREDHYLMQIAQEVAKTRAKHPNQVKLEGFKLVHTKKIIKKIKGKPLTKQGMEELSKQMWISRMSAPITVKREGEPDEIILPPKLQQQEAIKKQKELIEQKKQQKKQTQTKVVPQRNRRNRGKPTGT